MGRKAGMKEMVKRIAIAVTAVAVIFGSVSTPATVEAKGTAFINKKVSSKATPTIKSATRKDGKVSVTVTVPKAKVKKLGNVKKVTVAYGSTNNSKNFEAKKATVKVTKKGNQYTFTFKNKKILSYKVAYISVQLGSKSNWSKLYKVTEGGTTVVKAKYTLCCNSCDWQVEGYSLNELEKLHSKHSEEMVKAYYAQFTPPYSMEVILNCDLHSGYTWYK